jgi:hypothetical protein
MATSTARRHDLFALGGLLDTPLDMLLDALLDTPLDAVPEERFEKLRQAEELRDVLYGFGERRPTQRAASLRALSSRPQGGSAPLRLLVS